MPSTSIRSAYLLTLLTLFAMFLLGCNASPPALPGNPTGLPTGELTATAGPAATPTDTPSPSPTPLPPRMVLLAPAGSDPGLAASLEPVLSELASGAGLRFEKLDSLPASGPDLRLVVALPPDPGLAGMAAAAPGVQFLAAGISGLQPAANLSVIGAEGERPDRQAFMAGYMAAMASEDWRTGVLSVANTPAGKATQLGFRNGAVFYCGLCRSSFPPFVQYPVSAEVPAGAGQPEQQAAADLLLGQAVNIVFVAPGAGDDSLLAYLAQADIHLIGAVPPPAGVQDHWVATIQTEAAAAVRELVPKLLAGSGGANVDLPLVVTDRNESLFSAGKQRLLDEILADLQAGYIDTGVDPQTGDPR